MKMQRRKIKEQNCKGNLYKRNHDIKYQQEIVCSQAQLIATVGKFPCSSIDTWDNDSNKRTASAEEIEAIVRRCC